MADLSITATSVIKGAGAVVETRYPFGETVTAGMAVYLKSSDLAWWKAQADDTSAAAAASGIALVGGAAGQFAAVQTSGRITIGATVTVAKKYVLSATAGGICPIADITTTGHYLTEIGIGATAAYLDLNFNATGLTIP